MTKLHVSVPHELGQEEALRRIKAFIDQAKSQFASQMSGFTHEWKGGVSTFQLEAKGTSLAGTITVTEDKVEIESKLPMAAILFKGKIETALSDGITAILKK